VECSAAGEYCGERRALCLGSVPVAVSAFMRKICGVVAVASVDVSDTERVLCTGCWWCRYAVVVSVDVEWVLYVGAY
jgi:hypothetical protein